MKKIAIFLSTLMIILGVTGIATAVPFYEEYTGRQKVLEGNSYDFGFDLWFDNEYFDQSLPEDRVGTDSRLNLSQDSIGAQGEYSSATLYVDLFSRDRNDETVDITLSLGGGLGNVY